MKTTITPSTRTLAAIAREIESDWVAVHFSARPYLNAMRSLGTINDHYGLDPAREIVNYFLSNASTWRGETARRIKGELKKLLVE